MHFYCYPRSLTTTVNKFVKSFAFEIANEFELWIICHKNIYPLKLVLKSLSDSFILAISRLPYLDWYTLYHDFFLYIRVLISKCDLISLIHCCYQKLHKLKNVLKLKLILKLKLFLLVKENFELLFNILFTICYRFREK